MNTIMDKIMDILVKTSLEFLIIIGKVFLIILSFYIITKIINYSINKIIFSIQTTKKASPQRIETIQSILDNLIKYFMGIIAFVFILITVGVPWEGLLASAGILGVIIGIGAQELVGDTVNGFFVIFEGTYDIGEYIKIGEFEGYVEELGIKSTVLKTFENERITIPNSKVVEVINYSKNEYITYYVIETSYDSRVENIEQIICELMIPEINAVELIDNVEYMGLDEFKDSSVSYKLSFTTVPEKRFIAKRQVNSIVKKIMDKNKLEIPYQNITLSYAEGEKNAKNLE